VVSLLIVLPYAIGSLGKAFILTTNHGLGNVPSDLSWATIGGYAWNLLKPCAIAFAPILLAALAVGLAANFAQVGFVVSGESMNPSLARINPSAGLKRLLSATAFAEGVKACIKTLLFGYLAYSAIRDHWPELLNLSSVPPLAALGALGSLLHTIFLRIGIAWLILAALDCAFQRRQVDRQLRMTKDELRQEFKDMETSPELRMAMAQRRRKLSRGRMMVEVQRADVVVTNPTHFAVAIKYEPGKMHAPQVVAKGADYMAQRIREAASEHRVPIVPNPPLARQLYKRCEVGGFVPRELFQAVAEVLAYVYSTLRRIREDR
jgi:flagellar biosynthetic protein FlhB